jgi:hypothetical protein
MQTPVSASRLAGIWRSIGMRLSSITALAVLILLVAMTAFVLTPNERRSSSSLSLPGPLWASRP